MTNRRVLGSGPQDLPHAVRASEADLSEALPGIQLPDIHELRARGVLGARPATSPSSRRELGAGCRREPLPETSS